MDAEPRVLEINPFLRLVTEDDTVCWTATADDSVCPGPDDGGDICLCMMEKSHPMPHKCIDCQQTFVPPEPE